MKKKQQKQTLQQKYNPISLKIKWINFTLSFLFFSGLILTVFEINIFRKTIIDWKIPTGIWFGIGFISLLWLQKYLVKYYNTKNIFLQIVFCIGSFGGLFTYGFMASNYYLVSKNETEIIKAAIIETGHLAKGKNGCGNPYAHVYLKGKEKELVFPCKFEINNYKFLQVKIQRGLFGFDTIVEQVPVNE